MCKIGLSLSFLFYFSILVFSSSFFFSFRKNTQSVTGSNLHNFIYFFFLKKKKISFRIRRKKNDDAKKLFFKKRKRKLNFLNENKK